MDCSEKAREQVIVALDVPSAKEALALVESLEPLGLWFKLGLELFLSGEIQQVLPELEKRQKKVFLDLKLWDIPQTLSRSLKVLEKTHPQASLTTIHLQAESENNLGLNFSMGALGVLGVTLLTSQPVGSSLEKTRDDVCKKALVAKAFGCAGVVASPWEAEAVKKCCGKDFLVVCPGIRPVSKQALFPDDQKRSASPVQALRAGADLLVVGRPITQAENPKEALAQVLAQVKKA